MEKTFFGISMRPLNVQNDILEGTSSYNDSSLLYTYLTRQLIEEFLEVKAEIITPTTVSSLESVENGYRFVFRFEKEEYFSDIVKTTDLVIDDLARALIDRVAETSQALDREMIRMVFNRYFRAYCVECNFDQSVSDDHVINQVFHALDLLEQQGRNVDETDESKMISFLQSEAVRHVVGALAVS